MSIVINGVEKEYKNRMDNRPTLNVASRDIFKWFNHWPRRNSSCFNRREIIENNNPETPLEVRIEYLTKHYPSSRRERMRIQEKIINKIKKLEDYGKFKKLTINSCDWFPEEVFEIDSLKSLEELVIRALRSSEISEKIGGLTNLKSLRIIGGPYTEKLPDSLGELEKLEFLNIYGREHLKELPESSSQLENLTYLLLSGTGIDELPEEVCENLINNGEEKKIIMTEVNDKLMNLIKTQGEQYIGRIPIRNQIEVWSGVYGKLLEQGFENGAFPKKTKSYDKATIDDGVFPSKSYNKVTIDGVGEVYVIKEDNFDHFYGSFLKFKEDGDALILNDKYAAMPLNKPFSMLGLRRFTAYKIIKINDY